MMWFDRAHPAALHGDVREEVHTLCDGRVLEVQPDCRLDVRALPFTDEEFHLVVFDPPHLRKAGVQSWLAKKYGCLGANWRDDLRDGFQECWRVLAKGGTLVFKWNETQIALADVLQILPQRPLFGHTTTHNLKTHWMCFYKPVEVN